MVYEVTHRRARLRNDVGSGPLADYDSGDGASGSGDDVAAGGPSDGGDIGIGHSDSGRRPRARLRVVVVLSAAEAATRKARLRQRRAAGLGICV